MRTRGEIEGLEEFIGETQVGKMAMLLGRRVVGLEGWQQIRLRI